MRRTLIILLIFILLSSFFSSNVLSKNEEIIDEPNNNKTSNEDIIKKLLDLRFRIGSLIPGVSRYFVMQLRPPVPVQAYPEAINLTYNKEIYVDIGGKNPITGEWEKMVKIAGPWSWGWMNNVVRYSFEVDGSTSPDILKILNIHFDPEIIEMIPNRKNLNWPGAETPFKTRMSISLNPNIDPSIIPRDIILIINVTREEAIDKLGLLKGTPDYIKTDHDEYMKKEQELGIKHPYFSDPSMILYHNLLGKYYLFLINSQLPIHDTWVDSKVKVLIKIDKFYIGEIKPVPLIKIKPYEVKSIPVSVINCGSHIYTYNFRVKCDNKEFIVTPPSSVTLRPGEEKQAYVGVAAPRNFYSPGIITPITVEAYPVDDPTAVFSSTITLQMAGVHVVGSAVVNYGIALFFLLLMIILYLSLRKKYKEKINIIFKQIKKAKSEEIKKEKIEKKPSKKMITKKETIEKTKEIKPEKEKPVVEEKIKIKEKPVEEKPKPLVDKRKEKELRKKERLLLKLKREQEKQRKKTPQV